MSEMETQSPTWLLSEFVHETKFQSLPQSVVHQSKRLILDTVGCAMGARLTEMAEIVDRYVNYLGDSPQATVIGSGKRVSMTNASYANGRLGNALDADDSFLSVVHHGNPVVASALATCEAMGVPGRDLIVSVAVGFDVGARIGISMGPPELNPKTRDYGGGKIGGGSVGVVGAAAAAAKALGLQAREVAHTFGIAGTRATVPVAKWVEADVLPLIKLWDAGWVAEAGLSSALLAKSGLTAYPTVLDGANGLWRMEGAEACDFELMLRELGEKWFIMDTTLKPWPSCRWTHYPLTILSRIIREKELQPGEIERVTVRANPVATAKRFCNPSPSGLISCQFNHPHTCAMVALGVTPGPRWYDPEIVNSPEVRAFREKVHVELEPESLHASCWFQDGQIRKLPASVEVEARGQVFSGFTEYAQGDPWSEETYLSDGELKDKFRQMALPLEPSKWWSDQVEEIIDRIFGLEQLSSVRDLAALLFPDERIALHLGRAR